MGLPATGMHAQNSCQACQSSLRGRVSDTSSCERARARSAPELPARHPALFEERFSRRHEVPLRQCLLWGRKSVSVAAAWPPRQHTLTLSEEGTSQCEDFPLASAGSFCVLRAAAQARLASSAARIARV